MKYMYFFSGTKNSIDCTLILTEGDSAKTLAVAGLAVIGRDRYGVFPLKGKLLNTREASHKQVGSLSRNAYGSMVLSTFQENTIHISSTF